MNHRVCDMLVALTLMAIEERRGQEPTERSATTTKYDYNHTKQRLLG